MTIRAVIWDLGGVLVRTRDYSSRDALASRFGMTRPSLEELVYGEESGHRAQLGLIDINQHWDNVRTTLGIPEEELESFRSYFWRGDQLDSELVEYIRGLKDRYRTGLLSNAFSNLRQVIRDIWQFEDVFDQMIISAEEGLIKPDPRIYRIALDRLKVEPHEAVFIDDMLQNTEGAQNLNMHSIHFRSPEQTRLDLNRILEQDHR